MSNSKRELFSPAASLVVPGGGRGVEDRIDVPLEAAHPDQGPAARVVPHRRRVEGYLPRQIRDDAAAARRPTRGAWQETGSEQRPVSPRRPGADASSTETRFTVVVRGPEITAAASGRCLPARE